MKTRVALCVFVMFAACGDNSNECDPETTRNENGVCVGTQTCSDGTILVDGKCVIDPNACQGGTVLVGSECVDPAVLTADIEEAAEPNGLGLFELSTTPAGEIMLKAAGEKFVIHGKIIPFQDDDADGQLDADVDSYFVEVTSPTMLTITADGLNGLAAGFVSVANVASTNPLSDWVRFGINLTGDASKRQLFLPVAGTYIIGIGDTRTLVLSGASAGAPEGKPALEYYVTIEQQTTTPTPLTVSNGVATSSGMRNPGEVKLFSIAMGEGINAASLESSAVQLQSSLVITNTRGGATTFKALADGDDTTPAEVSVLGIRTGDNSTVVADSVLDYANQPTDFDLSVTIGSAGALSTSGGDVTQPGSATDFSVFHYDVGADGLLLGLDVAFDKPVAGVLVDEGFTIFSLFTFDPGSGFFFNDTFQSYKGLIKHASPGRYYFFVFDPDFDEANPEDITATSTYAAVMPVTITKGTALANQTVNAFESNPFSYAPAINTDPWQKFTGSGTGTGVLTAAFFDANAVGRLDNLVNTCGSFCEDRPPTFFTHTYAEAGQTRGRVLLDHANTTAYLVTLNTATVTGGPTFSLDFAAQDNVNDLATVAAGANVSSNNNVLDATTTIHRFVVRTGAGNKLTLTSEPDAALDTRIQRVNLDESASGAAINNGGVAAPDSTTFAQSASGFTVFTVNAVSGTGMFDLTAAAALPPYTVAAGATPFADACNGGTAVTFTDGDEGVSAAIDTPTGFDYFGTAAPQIKMFANGFLSVDTALVCASATSCFFGNADMPNAAAPNGIIAPYWDDTITTGCQKTMGTKLILQWNGNLFNAASQTVAMQVILDGANDTIEFVYATTHTATGSSATIGLENQTGTEASKISFNAAIAGPNRLFTPN